MASQTSQIVQQSLNALMENPDFLSTLQGQTRKQAFTSLAAILSTPNHIHKSYLRLPRENGDVVRIPAYRIQHNNILGPYKGGIRFHESVNEDEVANMAALMTLKNALHEVPFGGGKGGVVINPQQYTLKELNNICKRYVRYFSDILGPDKDIPAPDVGTGEREMDWMMAEYKSIHPGSPYLGSFTGKSVNNGGSLGRREATGKGVYYTFRYMLHDFLQDNKQWLTGRDNPFAETVLAHADRPLTLAIQGFGNVGSVAALEAYQCQTMNTRVTAASDRNVTLVHTGGLDIPALVAYARQHRGELPTTAEQLADCGVEASILSRDEILTLDVDVLFLAALEDQIRQDNMESIKAKIIVEGANAPISGDADRYFNQKGTVIIPDILANAGGVIVSYFEWLQARDTQFYTEDTVFNMLRDKMKTTFNRVLPQYFSDRYSLRQNCYMHAVARLSTILYSHGKLY